MTRSRSPPSWSGSGARSIRFGLAAIKGISETAVASILKARQEGGPFTSLADLCDRVDLRTVNRKVVEALIRSGACDAFGEARATLWAGIDHALGRAASAAQDRARGQTSLFGLLEAPASAEQEPKQTMPEWPQNQLLAAEKELLGFYVTGHPLTPYARLLEKYALATTATLGQMPARTMTRIGGLLTAVQQGVSKKTNKPYAMATLEDLSGSVQLLCLNESFEKHRALLQPNTALLVIGEVGASDEKPKLFPLEIIPLAEAPQRYTEQVHFRLHTAHLDAARLEEARALAQAHPGKCPLFLCLIRPAGEVVFLEAHERYRVTPSLALQQAADELFGEGTYYAKVDLTVPQRAARRWERRGQTADNGG